MIVKMKKMTLLLYHQEKENFLQSLSDLGVVHVIENPENSSDLLVACENNAKDCERVLKGLKRIKRADKKQVVQSFDLDASAVIGKFEELEKERV